MFPDILHPVFNQQLKINGLTLRIKDEMFYPEIGWLSDDDGEVQDNPEEHQGPHFPRHGGLDIYYNDSLDPHSIYVFKCNFNC